MSNKPGRNNNQSRRTFIRQGGLSVIGILTLPEWFKAWGVPYHPAYPKHNIPVDKGLDPAWVRSLHARGTVTTYRKSRNELQYIGMPAGGLHTGTLYMGGDGRLWLWGIYNDDREGVDPKTTLWNDGTKERTILARDGANYVDPPLADNKRVLEQGFALEIIQGEHRTFKQLRAEDWEEVVFEATYPRATVKYTDTRLPIEVVLKGGAFYIPLNAEDSALPATFFTIEVHNKSAAPMDVKLVGWLENGVRKITAKAGEGKKNIGYFDKFNIPAFGCSFWPENSANVDQRDAGTMAFGLMNREGKLNLDADPYSKADNLFSEYIGRSWRDASEKQIGSIFTSAHLGPGKSIVADYVITWHFNHTLEKLHGRMAESKEGHFYATRCRDADDFMVYIYSHFARLKAQTELWQKTFYDSTLPHWFLERTFLNIGTIATANTYRFASGRFWGWEGINCCEGTCTHVWQYGHTLARMFPTLERDTRQRVDLGVALQPDGGILFRGEFESRPAIDGQAGTILRIYREHQMSPDDTFLKSNWEKIKLAVRFLLAQDKNGDGLTDTPMENTLDAVWEGEIAWIAGLSIAAARAAQHMAEEMQDSEFAHICSRYVADGCRNMTLKLYNGEYFIHRPDPTLGKKKLGSYNTCHIDQVYGQSWAYQVGLGRLWEESATRSALKALWKYNFAPDVGPYIRTHTGGRPYALEGEAGMIMNTNPHNDDHPYGENETWQLGYFHECMSGFEHQVAAHYMAEGMTDEALVLTRAIHDRYHGSKRNPYNEIECSDHYARAMASYGTFISACGYEYHGPKGYMRFAPRLSPNDFKAGFVASEGWGTYEQKKSDRSFDARIVVAYGQVQLKTVSCNVGEPQHGREVSVKLDGKDLRHSVTMNGNDLAINLMEKTVIGRGQVLEILARV